MTEAIDKDKVKVAFSLIGELVVMILSLFEMFKKKGNEPEKIN